jgi:release factor glutamine methyltransferase
MTYREALARALGELYANPHLREDAALDATMLLLHALGISRAALIANYDTSLESEQQAVYDALIARRMTYEPVQYITGVQEFYGLPLTVTPNVLIPRPSTEHLVEAVLSEVGRDGELNILDVGTGSGAIAIALAYHLPKARVTALDLSPAALVVAAANAERNGVAGRIRFLESDLLSALRRADSASEYDEQFDLITANPPYVPQRDRDELHPQIADFEPAIAVFGGADGLDILRRLIPQVYAALKPNGLFAMEIGSKQDKAVAALLSDWNELRFVDDLLHIPRIAVARRP